MPLASLSEYTQPLHCCHIHWDSPTHEPLWFRLAGPAQSRQSLSLRPGHSLPRERLADECCAIGEPPDRAVPLPSVFLGEIFTHLLDYLSWRVEAEDEYTHLSLWETFPQMTKRHTQGIKGKASPVGYLHKFFSLFIEFWTIR